MKRSRKSPPVSLFAFQDIITGLCGVIIFFVLIMLVDLVMKRNTAFIADPELPIEVVNETERIQQEIKEQRLILARLRVATQKIVIATANQAAPEIVAQVAEEMDDRKQEIAALVSQVAELTTRLAAMKNADAQSKQKILEMTETLRILNAKLADLDKRNGITLIPERGEGKIPIYVICGGSGIQVLQPFKKGGSKFHCPFNTMKEGLSSILETLDHTTHTVIFLIRPSGAPYRKALIECAQTLGFSYGRDPLEEDVDVSLPTNNEGL